MNVSAVRSRTFKKKNCTKNGKRLCSALFHFSLQHRCRALLLPPHALHPKKHVFKIHCLAVSSRAHLMLQEESHAHTCARTQTDARSCKVPPRGPRREAVSCLTCLHSCGFRVTPASCQLSHVRDYCCPVIHAGF